GDVAGYEVAKPDFCVRNGRVVAVPDDAAHHARFAGTGPCAVAHEDRCEPRKCEHGYERTDAGISGTHRRPRSGEPVSLSCGDATVSTLVHSANCHKMENAQNLMSFHTFGHD